MAISVCVADIDAPKHQFVRSMDSLTFLALGSLNFSPFLSFVFVSSFSSDAEERITLYQDSIPRVREARARQPIKKERREVRKADPLFRKVESRAAVACDGELTHCLSFSLSVECAFQCVHCSLASFGAPCWSSIHVIQLRTRGTAGSGDSNNSKKRRTVHLCLPVLYDS